MVEFAQYLPDGVGPWLALSLVLVSFMTSAITGAFGLGGGMLLLAVLAIVFNPAVVVPLHGGIQLGSNTSRAFLLRHFIQWNVIFWICLGSILGTIIGGSLAVSMPEALFRGAIAAFILYSAWGPQPKVSARGPVANFIAGTVIAALGMIFGAVGPLLANFLRFLGDRRELVATHAAIVTVSHLAKVVTFTALGFAFAAFVPLMIAMVAAGFVGTWAGTRFLHRMPEAAFRIGLKIMLTVIALGLLRQSIWG
ncbi:sulfite exporter TauE/SafE family protein [Pelagibacterium montanilacus]|uniref:sulfite exporter TauE/SafE family protein n=1 Tax=Pelagibacterium montanilacus TaxID=2185280 RepID=UPI000F8C618E|nr:sulfite exporter TauE/SafE family protein [Pelagibacterium montanilacus]